MSIVAAAAQVQGGVNSYRELQAIINGERVSQGISAPNYLPTWTTQNPQTAAVVGGTCTWQLIPVMDWLNDLEVFVTISAISGGGAPAIIEDFTNAIESITFRQAGNVVQQLFGFQIANENQLRAPNVSSLTSLEECTGLHASLATRQALAAAPQTFRITIPGAFKQIPWPVSKLDSQVQVTLTFRPMVYCIENGSIANSFSITECFLNLGFGYTPAGRDQLTPRPIDQFMANVQAGPVTRLFNDLNMDQLPLPAGSTSSTLQMQNLRGIVKRLTFFVLRNSDFQSTATNDPTNYIQLNTFELKASGNNIWSLSAYSCESLRLITAPSMGVQNVVEQFIYPVVFDGMSYNRPEGENQSVAGAGFQFGDAGQLSPTITLTYPALAGDSTLFLMSSMWNALQFTKSSAGGIKMTRVCV